MSADVSSPRALDRHAVQVIDGGELDVAAHAALQQRVFGGVLEDNGIPMERLGPEVFAWKLAPPRGPARIALVEGPEGEILSSCSAFPVELAAGGEPVRGWHVCDAVTAPEARGQGLFGRVLRTLREDLPAEDWLFAFPNKQSRGAFTREGFARAEVVPLSVRPVWGRPRELPDAIAEVDVFGPDHDALAARLAESGELATLRSSEYLTWRYRAHPFFDYRAYELRRDGQLDGLLVLNRMKARGRVSMWVMELLGVDKAARRQLGLVAQTLAVAQECDVVLSMASARLPGAIRLPRWLSPKTHVLMVRSGGEGESRPPGDWVVETGDWDVF